MSIGVGIAAVLTSADFSFPIASFAAWFAVVSMTLGLLQGKGLLLPVGIGVLGLVATGEALQGSIARSLVPILGAALLASAESGYWSFELQQTVAQSNSVIARRVGVIVGLAAVGVALSAGAAQLLKYLET